MALFHIICLIFLTYHMVGVHTAPGNMKSNENYNPNILFYDDSSAKTQLIENNEPARPTFINNNIKPPNNNNMLPFLDDVRQNWGILVNETNLEDEDEDNYKRPINIPKPTSDDPIKPVIETTFRETQAKPLSAAKRTPPALVSGNTILKLTSGIKKTKIPPTSCDIALVVCCMRNSNLEQCFLGYGCFRKIVPENACKKNELLIILKQLKEYLISNEI